MPKHIFKSIIKILILMMLFSCKNNFKEVQQIGVSNNAPYSIADHINLKYTDSGKLKANLISPKMLDYSNRSFPFSEFPEGIKLFVFDENNKQSVITSNYAISYNNTGLIDLQGNVVAITSTLDTLYAEQLYYDQKKERLFSNFPARFIYRGNESTPKIFDTNTSFFPRYVTEFSGVTDISE